jgi:alpha-amylase/alpha-mannosidase (GH57 family)
MDTVYLAFLWHMHQPYYKNLSTGEYLLPWVLLHGTKDYFDMAHMVQEFDGLRQNFNLVPSLLLQLRDYEDLNVEDAYVRVFRRPPQDLSDDERVFLLKNFFNANWENMIRPFPRYWELLTKRGFYYPREGLDEIKGYFTNEELRDIQVLFFLAWIDPLFYGIYDGLKFLKSKGRAFTEDDKLILADVQKEILKGILPLHADLSSQGKIEISTSPFYHPIIPLLIDGTIAREAMPDVELPARPFHRPEDAARQIHSARELFFEIFHFYPKGMWPPEGSVSDDALELYMEHGVEWLATDEDILLRSLRIESSRDGEGSIANPELLYKPYRFERKGKSLDVVYRDKYLSDLISFHYSRSDPKEAANDLLKRIRKIGESARGRLDRPLVTIAMDGENAWESYRNDGRDFLAYFYEGILKDGSITPVTIGDYLKESTDFGTLHHTFAGSWIGHNFAIWIGHVEDNTGWNLLSETRDFLEREDPEKKNGKAWESIYIAEGSDWFWWFGDEHSSENDEIFDFLFRENLANVYSFLGKEPPEVLSIPVMLEEREVKALRKPVNFIEPVMDGRVTNYFEWMGSGYIEGKGHGVAMHASSSMIKGCYFGFNETTLFLRTDIDRTFVQDMEELSFEINVVGAGSLKVVYDVAGAREEVSWKGEDGVPTKSDLPVQVVFGEVLEVAIPFSVIGVKARDKADLWVSLKLKGMEADRIPKRGYLTVEIPAETFEMEMWYV